MNPTFRAARGIGGEYTPPPDKSITHRALMLAAIGSGASTVVTSACNGRLRLHAPLSGGTGVLF